MILIILVQHCQCLHGGLNTSSQQMGTDFSQPLIMVGWHFTAHGS